MIFSSIPFLYYFLPAVIILYFVVPKKFSNGVLLLSSLIFYGYGEPKYLLLMGAAILLAYGFGLLIPRSRIFFYLSVAASLGMLCWFKYADFFIENFSRATGLSIELLGIALPVGISFYTFQVLSYTIDVKRERIAPQRNLVRFATYVALFPQLIAGPIVVYADVEAQLDPARREISAHSLYEGVRRFIIGLSKKVLLANGLGQLCDIFNSTGADERSVLFYWIYAVAFTLQIYFDFSGYSDMAIGLGRIFGFSFPENFRYPYISKSITEFWRRWHMTLSSWFREYVYIPLGGNRVGRRRWIFNLFLVWALTGLWHGAAWTFLVWGLLHGSALLLEKLWLGDLLRKGPAWLAHCYVILVVLISMVIFNGASLGQAFQEIGSMFGAGGIDGANPLTWYYLRSYGLLLLIGIIGSLPWIKKLVEKIAAKLNNSSVGSVFLTFVEPIVLIGLFLLVTAYLVDGSFNPFLYFRF